MNVQIKLLIGFLILFPLFLKGQCPASLIDLGDGAAIAFVNPNCPISDVSDQLTDGNDININGETYTASGSCDGSGNEFFLDSGTPVIAPASYTVNFGSPIGTCNYSGAGVLLGPEVIVLGSSNNIADESTLMDANTLNGTDFGATCGTVDITYTIMNTGTGDLVLNGTPTAVTMTGSLSDFTITQPATTTILPGESTTFMVTFNPTSIGQKTGTISIDNNDTDENPFNFVIKGTGGLPVITVIAMTSSIEEGGNLVFQFTRSCSSGLLIVDYSIDFANGTAIAGDFSVDDSPSHVNYSSGTETGTITFADGESNVNLTVITTEEMIVEISETIVVKIDPWTP